MPTMVRGPMAAGSNGLHSGGGSAKPRTSAIGFAPVNSKLLATVDRFMFSLTVLFGHKVEVQLKDGTAYEGLYHTFKPKDKDSGAMLALKYAKKVLSTATGTSDTYSAPAEKPIELLHVAIADMVQLIAKDMRLSQEDLGPTSSDGFDTDAAISRGRGGQAGRELQKWMPDDGADSSSFLMEADGGGWDQFAVNKDKFGVQTSWDENLYTTRLDKEACGISEVEAARIAAEIERGGGHNSSNPHVLEDRIMNIKGDDSQMDEEERYSSVARVLTPPQQSQHDVRINRSGHGRGLGGYPGPHSHGGSSNNLVQGRSSGAWGSSQSGVAAVVGAPPPPPPPPPPTAVQVAPPPPPPPPTGAAVTKAQAIDIDPRKDMDLVRQMLQGTIPRKDRSSPKSAFVPPPMSPLVKDLKQLAALNLNPGNTTVPIDVRKDFHKYKTALAPEVPKPQPITTSSIASRRDQELGAFRNFSENFKGISSGPRSNAEGRSSDVRPSAGAPDATKSNVSVQANGTIAAAAMAASTPTAVVAAPAAAARPAAIPSRTPEQVASVTVKATATTAASNVEAAKPAAAAPVSKALNPNAKSFSLNINAKAFVPGGSAARSTSGDVPVAPGATSSSASVAAAAAVNSNDNSSSSPPAPAAAAMSAALPAAAAPAPAATTPLQPAVLHGTHPVSPHAAAHHSHAPSSVGQASNGGGTGPHLPHAAHKVQQQQGQHSLQVVHQQHQQHQAVHQQQQQQALHMQHQAHNSLVQQQQQQAHLLHSQQLMHAQQHPELVQHAHHNQQHAIGMQTHQQQHLTAAGHFVGHKGSGPSAGSHDGMQVMHLTNGQNVPVQMAPGGMIMPTGAIMQGMNVQQAYMLQPGQFVPAPQMVTHHLMPQHGHQSYMVPYSMQQQRQGPMMPGNGLVANGMLQHPVMVMPNGQAMFSNMQYVPQHSQAMTTPHAHVAAHSMPPPSPTNGRVGSGVFHPAPYTPGMQSGPNSMGMLGGQQGGGMHLAGPHSAPPASSLHSDSRGGQYKGNRQGGGGLGNANRSGGLSGVGSGGLPHAGGGTHLTAASRRSSGHNSSGQQHLDPSVTELMKPPAATAAGGSSSGTDRPTATVLAATPAAAPAVTAPAVPSVAAAAPSVAAVAAPAVAIAQE